MLKIELGQAATSKGSMADEEEGEYPFSAKKNTAFPPPLPLPLSFHHHSAEFSPREKSSF